jgi:hypothetical protein
MMTLLGRRLTRLLCPAPSKIRLWLLLPKWSQKGALPHSHQREKFWVKVRILMVITMGMMGKVELKRPVKILTQLPCKLIQTRKNLLQFKLEGLQTTDRSQTAKRILKIRSFLMKKGMRKPRQ